MTSTGSAPLAGAGLVDDHGSAPGRSGILQHVLGIEHRYAQAVVDRYPWLGTNLEQSLILDGVVAGTWKVAATRTQATLTLTPFEPLAAPARAAVRALPAFLDGGLQGRG